MISVAQARAIMLEHVAFCGAESVPLAEALGRTLAETIQARRAHPPFRASAMDGYALRSADTPGRLRLVGEAGAGRALARALQESECARIFTGAPLPEGADAVLIQEDARRDGDAVEAPRIAPDRHVRPIGIDFAAGALLLAPPTVLTAPAIALAAAAGRAHIAVARRPRIAILGGGDEIVAPGEAPGPAHIFDSASPGVAGLATTWGAHASAAPPYHDDAIEIAAAIEAGLDASDLTIVIGGASVGDHDHARAATARLGAELLFDKVALRPGKPTWFAVRDGKTVLGLPGNPASAFVCARLFLNPLIARMLGSDTDKAIATRAARLRRPLGANGPRETYLRAMTQNDSTGQVWVDIAADQDSSLVRVLASANALVVREPNAASLEAGAIVQALPIL